MSNIVSTRMLVKTSVEDNNNKFWEATLFSNDDVKCRWGRVGTDGQTKTFSSAGEKFVNQKIKEKNKKGYKEMQMVAAPSGGTVKVTGNQLRNVAKKQIKRTNCPITDKLIDYLVDVNQHDITTASGGKLTVDVDTGLIKTDVGVAVTQDTLDRARMHLVALSTCINNRDWASADFINNINEYLMCVPQAVGRSRGWERYFIQSSDDVQKQGALIDSMESTLKAFSKNQQTGEEKEEEEVFNVDLSLIEDSTEINRIHNLYEKTLQRMHVSRHLKVKRAYSVHIESMAKKFEDHGAKLNPIWELWHGTRASNLLSILKGGLIIPPSNAAHVTGRAFGNGIYLSDQSTKALNYSYGYWGGNKDNNCFMFLCMAGMGKYYTPPGPINKHPPGYDSVYAIGGKSGVINNEMIVPKTSQVNLVRLVEFAP